ncbi:MAG: CvpA family protein [Planctomycetales bacterium]|nr:CvpA family protein [Planctomycetales bacterium]
MQTYDLLMLVVLAGATLFGFWKGLAWQIASLASIFVSYFVAVRFREPVAAAIDAEPPWNMFLAMLILYIAASLVVWVAFGFVRRFINQLQLKEFDRQIGALLGLGKGILLCVIITLFAVTLLSDQRRQTIVDSTSGYYIAVLLDRSHGLMPPEVHEVLDPYIRKLDANHGQRAEPLEYPSNWGGPLFGGTDAGTSTTPASNRTLREQGGWPGTASQPQPLPDMSQPVRDLQQWSNDTLQSGRQAIEDRIRTGQQQLQNQFRDSVREQLDRYLPPSN